ncbi:hypothetical protein J6590_040503 [Homalodisca vitripennis]|nr:hypothetical protein J6590_040503 [Homalodisca vitripennis]
MAICVGKRGPVWRGVAVRASRTVSVRRTLHIDQIISRTGSRSTTLIALKCAEWRCGPAVQCLYAGHFT